MAAPSVSERGVPIRGNVSQNGCWDARHRQALVRPAVLPLHQTHCLEFELANLGARGRKPDDDRGQPMEGEVGYEQSVYRLCFGERVKGTMGLWGVPKCYMLHLPLRLRPSCKRKMNLTQTNNNSNNTMIQIATGLSLCGTKVNRQLK